MDASDLFLKLKNFGLHTKEAYYSEAFSRNIGILTEKEQEMLANATVAIPGMGGVGGVHLVTLVRTGIGRFHLSDFDIFEPANVNRQFGARVSDFGKPKLEVMKECAIGINPYVSIKEFSEGINEASIDNFLDGVDVVLDGIDFFNFHARRLLFSRAREKGIYVITAGPLGFSSAMLIFSPHEGMSFDEFFNIVDGMTPTEQLLSFAIGLAPRATHLKYMDSSKVDLRSKQGPSLGIACQICSGMAATEAIRIILGKGHIKPAPYYFQFDPYLQKYCKGKLYMGNRNPIQKFKKKAASRFFIRKMESYQPPAPDFPSEKVTTSDILPQEVIRFLIRAGLQAPSGDNAQPWKFSYKDNIIDLYLDKDADHSFFNFQQIASIISCGAVLENIRVAASAFGLKPKINFLPDGGTDNLMASIHLSHENTAKDPLYDSVWKRHTNRKFYQKKTLSQCTLNNIKKCISNFPGTRLHLITSKTGLKKLADLVYHVDRIRTENRQLHEHLCQMIRFTSQDALKKRDGLPLKNLEAGPVGELFLKATRSWSAMKFANQVGIGRFVPLHAYLGIIHSSGAGLLTVDGRNTIDFLKGGQTLEKIWLTITRKGLCMQPMAAIPLFWYRWQTENGFSFSPPHRDLLSKVWKEFNSLFPGAISTKRSQIMLFRFGSVKDIQHRTYRKKIDSFLTTP